MGRDITCLPTAVHARTNFQQFRQPGLSELTCCTQFFESLSKANLYAICYQLKTAKKAETRERRMKKILEMMKRGEKFH